MFGLANADGTLYGVAGQDVFEIDTSDGTPGSTTSFSGQGLNTAFGATRQSVPLPASLGLVGTGLIGLGLIARRRAQG